MTVRQENDLQKARNMISGLRALLDGVMYYGEPLTDTEFARVRAAYDKVCEANDKL